MSQSQADRQMEQSQADIHIEGGGVADRQMEQSRIDRQMERGQAERQRAESSRETDGSKTSRQTDESESRRQSGSFLRFIRQSEVTQLLLPSKRPKLCFKLSFMPVTCTVRKSAVELSVLSNECSRSQW